jgi:hypothetical protein
MPRRTPKLQPLGAKCAPPFTSHRTREDVGRIWSGKFVEALVAAGAKRRKPKNNHDLEK